jgi:hypothetical protein
MQIVAWHYIRRISGWSFETIPKLTSISNVICFWLGGMVYYLGCTISIDLPNVYLKLATAARSVNDKVEDERIKYENFLVMIITMGSLVAFSNDGIGFLTGMIGSVLLAIQRLGPSNWYEQFKEGIMSLKLQKQNTDDHILITSNNDLREETSSNHSRVDVPRGAK